jgi:hypothetical protein
VGDRAAPALAAVELADGGVDRVVGGRGEPELRGRLDLQAVLQDAGLAELGDDLAADLLGVVGGAQAEHVDRGDEAQRLGAGGVLLLAVM